MRSVVAKSSQGSAERGAGRASAVVPAQARFWALGLMLLAAFAFGGGSRGDVSSLIVLRPLSFALLAYALIFTRWQDWRTFGIPGLVVIGVAGLCLLQLVPLPPALWTALPGRELPHEITAAMGWSDVWYPLTLSPSRTLNSFFALGVPLATLALLASVPVRAHRALIWCVLALGGASGLLALGQLMGPPDGPLYLYRITNEGLGVGLFANRNHQAIFLASLLPLLVYLGLSAWSRKDRAGAATQITLTIGMAAFIVPLVLVTGSRAGTALLFGIAAALGVLVWRVMDRQPNAGEGGRTRRKLVAPALVLAVGALAAITHLASRSLAFDRLLGEDNDAALRREVLPHLWSMFTKHFPAGSGLGTFRQVWEVIEPRDLLRPQYLNQAHNDPLQFLIETGVLGGLLLALGLFWFARSGWRAWQAFNHCAARGAPPNLALFTWLALGVLLAGSVFDYPLRTPALMAVAALLAGLIQLSLSPSRDVAPDERNSQ